MFRLSLLLQFHLVAHNDFVAVAVGATNEAEQDGHDDGYDRVEQETRRAD